MPRTKPLEVTTNHTRGKDRIIYVRMNEELYTMFKKFHTRFCKENFKNPNSFGVGSLVREFATKELNRAKARRKG